MIRFQCPHCSGIIASEIWEPGAATECAYCSKQVNMPTERLAPGMLLGDFLIIRKHGAGGMGIVYFAHQISLDRPAAIKVLNSEFSKDSESVKAFIREARSAAKLNHPNIVQAYAVGEEDGIFYFAMEFIYGKTMKEVLQETKKLDPRVAARIILQVSDALDCAWKEQKIIHRDIKPDNIMQCAVDNNDKVKLADLGLSGVFGDDANDDSDEVVGTPQYISPEQLTGVVTDTRSDIYSLGATFYHLVTGQFPYNAENTDEIARQHVYGTLTPPKNINADIPQALNDIIVKMMAKTPEGRYQNCAELSQALKKFLENADKTAGGLSGNKLNSSAGVQPKLGGGLSGAGAQPRIIVPASPTKLTLKIADKKSDPAPEEKAEKAEKAPETPAATPESPAKPTIKLGIKPAVQENESKLNLAMNQKRSDSSPEKAEAIKIKSHDAPAEPAVEPEKPAVEPPESTPPPETAEVPAETPVETPAETPAVAAEESPAEAPEKADAPAENTEAENVENTEDAAVKKSGKLWAIIAAVVLILALAGGAAWYFMIGKKVEKNTAPPAVTTPANPEPAPAKEPENPEVPEEQVITAPVTATPNTPVYKTPEAKVEKVSPFMREASKLEDLYLSNEASFVQTWKQRYNKIKPANAAEKKFYNSLEESFINADERVYVNPSRQALIKAYEKQVALVAQQQAAKAYRERIINAEKEALAFSEASAENYAADLQRKMGMLDYVMISAAKSGRPADWQKFHKALELAKAEPQRVADRNGFGETAKKLADYAKRLEVVATQGKFISDLLVKNKLKGKAIELEDSTVTVSATNRSQIILLQKFKPQVVKPKNAPQGPKKPKAVSQAQTKGKKPAAKAPAKKAPAKKAPAKAKTKMVTPKPKTHKISLFDKDVAKVSKFMKIVETSLGRSDQFFYYMLFNGNFQNDLTPIAPDKFWKKQVNLMAKRYFARVLFLATDQQLVQLKKTYGAIPAFNAALKEFEKKQ